MADFRAQVKAVLDKSSINTLAADIQKSLNNKEIKFKVDTKGIENASKATKDYNKACSDAAKQQLLMTRADTLSNRITAWMNNNKKAAREYATELQNLQKRLGDKNLQQSDFRQISAEFQKITSGAKAAGLATTGFTANMKSAITTAIGIGSVFQAFNTGVRLIKDMTNEVVSLDNAMTQFKIVTRDTAEAYESFYASINNTAKEIAARQTDLIDSATTYARLGYNTQDAGQLAKFTSMLKNVGKHIA